MFVFIKKSKNVICSIRDPLDIKGRTTISWNFQNNNLQNKDLNLFPQLRGLNRYQCLGFNEELTKAWSWATKSTGACGFGYSSGFKSLPLIVGSAIKLTWFGYGSGSVPSNPADQDPKLCHKSLIILFVGNVMNVDFYRISGTFQYWTFKFSNTIP